MSVYVIAHLKIFDRASYDTYKSAFLGVLKHFDGTLLVADENPQVLEGDWQGDKVVVFSFPSEEHALGFQSSDMYRQILPHRKAGAGGLALLARSVR